MKYGKLMAKFFAQRTNNNAQVAVAMVAGLAAGAIISILFAPSRGSATRKAIADQAKNVGNGLRNPYTSLKNKITGNHHDSVIETEIPHFVHTVPKKRKSDVKDLIHEAHSGEQHTEQPLS